jgi:TetR/AcrR family transcriptional regulator, tetracycline repressor protein
VPISREDVVRAAVEVLDDEGLPGLTLRAVATRLGVSAPTLYWHVKDKRHLLDLVAAHVLAERPDAHRPPRPGEAVWEWLAESARRNRALLLAHRDGVHVVAGNRPTEGDLPRIEQTLQVLVAAGLEPGEAVRVVTALGSYILGDALETQAARDRPLEELPAEVPGFPTLAAAGRTAGDDDERFEDGLRLFVDGLRVRLEQRLGERAVREASGRTAAEPTRA